MNPTLLKSVQEYEEFMTNNDAILVDAFPYQVAELAKSHPALHSEDITKSAVYVYFPWNNRVVRTVGSELYELLRTARNRDLITHKEQEQLREKRIAVFGLSVGSNIALLLSQAGISNSMTIADFDLLDTTNLNRILGGVHQIGEKKTAIMAEKIYEMNPFADLTVIDEPMTEELLDELLKDGLLDLIIEEVDDFEFKIKCRMLAMKYNVPVLMITDNGDGVVLHVERFDLDYSSVFGKSPEYWMKKMSAGKPSLRDISDLIIDDIIGGAKNVDPRMLNSVEKVVAGELPSWPQLGSAAMLAGVVAVVQSKLILLDHAQNSDIRESIFIPIENHGKHTN